MNWEDWQVTVSKVISKDFFIDRRRNDYRILHSLSLERHNTSWQVSSNKVAFAGNRDVDLSNLVNLVLLKMYMQSNVDHDPSQSSVQSRPAWFLPSILRLLLLYGNRFISSFYILINFSVLFIYVYIYFEEEKSRLDPSPADIKLTFFSTERSQRFSTGLKIR